MGELVKFKLILMTKVFFYFLVLFLPSCSPSTNNLNALDGSASSGIVAINSSDALTTDTTGFLSNCKSFRMHQGALQGTNADKDSINYLCFSECYDCPETYKIIFVRKGGVEYRKSVGYKPIWEEFLKSCSNNFSDFDCFAFVLPMRDPEKQEDIHAMNIDFPVTVRAYKRISLDNWQQVKVLKVNTFEEYAALQFATIYGLNK